MDGYSDRKKQRRGEKRLSGELDLRVDEMNFFYLPQHTDSGKLVASSDQFSVSISVSILNLLSHGYGIRFGGVVVPC